MNSKPTDPKPKFRRYPRAVLIKEARRQARSKRVARSLMDLDSGPYKFAGHAH